MEFVFRCSACDQTLVATHTQAARHARCPTCGAPTRVPGPPAWRVDPVAGPGPCPSCGATLSPLARKCAHCGEFLDAAFLARKVFLEGITPSATGSPPSGAALGYLGLAMGCLPCLCFPAIFVCRLARKRIAAGGAGNQKVAVAGLVIAYIWCTVSLLAALGGILRLVP